MIKKILSGLIVSSTLVLFNATANAFERPNFSIGISGAAGAVSASGFETEGTDGEKINSNTEVMEIALGSGFLEVNFPVLSVGVNYVFTPIETDTTSRTDSFYCGSVQCLNLGGGKNTGTSSIKAEFKDLITAYIEINVPNTGGLYLTAGAMQVEVMTKEQLHTDSSYPDATLDGTMAGIGYKNTYDNGMFFKFAAEYHDWDRLAITATSVSTGTKNGNSVHADITGAVARLSLGKTF